VRSSQTRSAPSCDPNLITSFFNQGYKDGFDHGRLHGLFEGRELGKEKAFEIWEELGYYEGWAGLFLKNLKSTGKEGRYVYFHPTPHLYLK
jgi:hypothetical protein